MKRLITFIVGLLFAFALVGQETETPTVEDLRCWNRMKPVYYTAREFNNGYIALVRMKRFMINNGDLIHVGVLTDGYCGDVSMYVDGDLRVTKTYNPITGENKRALYESNVRVKPNRILRFETTFCGCSIEVDLGKIRELD